MFNVILANQIYAKLLILFSNETSKFSFIAGGLSQDLDELEEKLSRMEEERDTLNLELEKANDRQEELQGKLAEAKEKLRELEIELDEVRQELIDAKNIPQGLSAGGDSIEVRNSTTFLC